MVRAGRRSAARAAHRHRQRVLRRAAGPPVRADRSGWAERMVGADRGRPAGVRAAAGGIPSPRWGEGAQTPGCGGQGDGQLVAGRRDHRNLAGSDRHHGDDRRPPEGRGRSGARDRLRLRGAGVRRHAPGAPRHSAPTTRSPRPAKPTSPPTSILPRSRPRRQRAGAEPRGLITQGVFLARLGLAERAERLAGGQDAAEREAIRAAAERLAGRSAMGELFKVLAVSGEGLALPAFDGDFGGIGTTGGM